MIGLIARPYPSSISVATPGYDLPAFPASNAANNDFGRVFSYRRAAQGIDGIDLIVDLGSPKSVDVIALLWHNISSSPVVIRASNSPDGMTAALYSGSFSSTTGSTRRDVLPFSKMLITLPNAVAARYWRIGLPADGNGKINSVSRIFVGKGAKFAIGPQKALLGAKDMNASIITETGETRQQEDVTLIRPVVSLSFEYAKLTEMEEILGQYTLGLGTSKPMLICTDLTTQYIQDNVAFGRPEKVIALESTMYDIWSFEAVVTSIGP